MKLEPGEVYLKSLGAGEVFEDMNGQKFTKLGVIVNPRGQRKQMVICTWSPIGRKAPGEITGAFFTAIGTVLYLPGNQIVLKPKPVLMLCDRAEADYDPNFGGWAADDVYDPSEEYFEDTLIQNEGIPTDTLIQNEGIVGDGKRASVPGGCWAGRSRHRPSRVHETKPGADSSEVVEKKEVA